MQEKNMESCSKMKKIKRNCFKDVDKCLMFTRIAVIFVDENKIIVIAR